MLINCENTSMEVMLQITWGIWWRKTRRSTRLISHGLSRLGSPLIMYVCVYVFDYHYDLCMCNTIDRWSRCTKMLIPKYVKIPLMRRSHQDKTWYQRGEFFTVQFPLYISNMLIGNCSPNWVKVPVMYKRICYFWLLWLMNIHQNPWGTTLLHWLHSPSPLLCCRSTKDMATEFEFRTES